MAYRTEEELAFLERVRGYEQQDLIAMLEDWIDFKELPSHCMSEVMKRQPKAPVEQVYDGNLTIAHSVRIVASSPQEAEEAARQMYESGDACMQGGDITFVTELSDDQDPNN